MNNLTLTEKSIVPHGRYKGMMVKDILSETYNMNSEGICFLIELCKKLGYIPDKKLSSMLKNKTILFSKHEDNNITSDYYFDSDEWIIGAYEIGLSD